MKNKFIKVISLFLSTILIMATFTACSKKENEVGPYTVIANFENWAPDFQTIKVMYGFGKVSRSEDIVKSGKYSAKLNPLGAYLNPTTTATIYFPLKSEALGFNKTNLLKYKSLNMSFYNDEETTQKVEISFVTGITNDKTITKSAIGSINLPSKQWYDYEYKIDAQILNYMYNLKNILGIALSFENAHSRDLADAPNIYLDDMVFVNRESEAVVKDEIILKPYEVCDFEELYQQYIFVPHSTKDASVPELSVVRATEEGLIAPSGEYMLKVIAKGSGIGDDGGTWPGMILVQKVIEKTVLSKIDPEEWEDYSVAFDVYNANDVSEYFSMKFDSTVPYGAMVGFTVEPKKWNKVSYSFAQIAGYNAWAGGPNEGRITKPGSWSISWLDYKDTTLKKVFYFDNFRIEKKI